MYNLITHTFGEQFSFGFATRNHTLHLEHSSAVSQNFFQPNVSTPISRPSL